jgi:alpha-mannosidase
VDSGKARLGGPTDVEVWNTGDAPRSDVVVLDAADAVTDARGKPVPGQRLRDGRFAFLAVNVPARGSRRYRLSATGGDARVAGPPAPRPSAIPMSIETSRFRVTVDPTRGVIASLVDKATGRELARGGAEGGLDRYVYVPGRDPQGAVFAGRGTVRIGERGPLVQSLVWRANAPGTDGIESEVILYEGLDRVEIVNRIQKKLVYDPEAVLYRFAFAARGPEVRISVPGGWYRPEVEQLPGASRNYFSDRKWIEVRDSAGAPVTLVTLDVPMLQLGTIATDAIVTGWKTHTAPSATVFSYAMDNYWGTNYRAAQEGRVELRYVILPAAGEAAEAPRLVGIRGEGKR